MNVLPDLEIKTIDLEFRGKKVTFREILTPEYEYVTQFQTHTEKNAAKIKAGEEIDAGEDTRQQLPIIKSLVASCLDYDAPQAEKLAFIEKLQVAELDNAFIQILVLSGFKMGEIQAAIDDYRGNKPKGKKRKTKKK